MGWAATPEEVTLWRDGRGVVRSTAWAVLASGVEGAGPPSSLISKSSSLSDLGSPASEWGGLGSWRWGRSSPAFPREGIMVAATVRAVGHGGGAAA